MKNWTASNYSGSALAAFDSGELDEAIQFASKGVELYPDYAELYRFRSTFFEANGQIEEAIRDIAEYNRLEPESPSFFYQGYLLAKGGRLSEAEECLSKQLNREHNDMLAYLVRSKVRFALGKTDEAISDLRYYYGIRHPNLDIDEVIDRFISTYKNAECIDS